MTTHRPPFVFAAASLLPACAILIAAGWGGGLVWAALLSITLLVLTMDRLGVGIEASVGMTHLLPRAVGLLHFVALGATLWAIGQNGALVTGEKVVLAIAMGLYAGQISNACAHELIHRPDRYSRLLGTAVYCSILNGQHVSAHLLVHHVHAGTDKDPTSAALGRGFYRFALAATVSEFMAGWRAETRRRAGKRARGLHPYAIYIAGAVVSLLGAAVFGGVWAVLALIAMSLHAQMQLLLSDYVQHYGLRRRIGTDGKPAPMGYEHAWNAPHAYSAAMMMNAPRHSDHHMNPARTFPHLNLTPETMPTLPHSLPVMGAIALIPPLWRRMMDPRCRVWMQGPPSCQGAA